MPALPTLIKRKTARGERAGRCDAVSLFVDIADFTSTTEKLLRGGSGNAELLSELLAATFNPLVGTVHAYGGFVTAFVGDGFRALFPLTKGDGGCLAVAAALEMQRSLAAVPLPAAADRGGAAFGIKLALDAGQVAWRVVGGPGERTVLFHGSAIDGAAAAEGMAEAGDLLVACSLRDRLGRRLDCEPVGKFFRVTGFRDPLPPPPEAPLRPDPDSGTTPSLLSGAIGAADWRGEFRHVLTVSVGIPGSQVEEGLSGFMDLAFQLKRRFGGFLMLDSGEKGTHLLLLWGAPTSSEDDIDRGLNFVLELRDRSPVPVRAGVTYGLAYAGPIGPPFARAYTSYGPSVTQSVRQMMAAAWGDLWLDEATARRAGHRFATRPIGRIPFKGFDEPKSVHALLGRLERAAGPFQGRMVGRQRELAELGKRVAPIFEGAWAGVTLLVGEPGVGKSRLLYELRRAIGASPARPLTWLHCPADPIGRRSLEPFRHVLRSYFGQAPAQGEAENKRRFDQRMDALLAGVRGPDASVHEELIRGRSFIGALVDLHWPDSAYERLDPRQRLAGSLRALSRFLQALSRLNPLIVEAEDCHWFDADSISLLRELAATPPASPLAVLATSRPGRDATLLASEVADRVIDLDALHADDLCGLAADRLGGPVSPALVHLLMTETGGNPFFAEQLLLYLREQALLIEGPEGIRPVGTRVLVPSTIHAVLIARFDLLPRDVRDTVQAASVLGREVNVRVLREVCGRSAAIEDHLVAGEQAAIWSRAADDLYHFRHALMRDAAYDMQSRSRRRDLHGKALTALEVCFGAEPGPWYAEMAFHAERADQVAAAVHYLERAAGRAIQAGAYREAMRHLEHALGLLDRAPERETLAEQELRILVALGSALIAIRGQATPAVKQTYDRALELCGRLGDNTAELGPVLFGLAAFYFFRGELRTTQALCRRSLALAEALDDPAVRMEAHLLLSHSCFWQAKHEESQRHARRVIALYDPGRHEGHMARYAQNPRITALVCGTWGLWMMGYPDRALAQAREAEALAEALRHPYSLVIAVQITAWLHQHRREFEPAMAAASRMLGISDERNFPWFSILGEMLMVWGEAQLATAATGCAARIETARRSWQDMGSLLAMSFGTVLHAETCLVEGLFEQGLRSVEEALSGRYGEEVCYHAELHRLRGELLMAQAERDRGADALPSEAMASFERALDLARRQSARMLELRSLVSLCRHASRAHGRGAAAVERLAMVYEGFTEGRATPDLAEAARILEAHRSSRRARA